MDNLELYREAIISHGLPDPYTIVPDGEILPVAPYADPLPQALILTAIVISFGVLAFTMVLMHRAYESVGTDDLHQMRGTDR